MSEQEKDIDVTEQEMAPANLPGHRLRITREDLHLSKDEVAHHLHLDVSVVEALEADDYETMPSPAFVCGYMRSYARILKLPEDEIVNAYSKGREINAALIPDNVSIVPEKQMNPVMIKIVVVIVMVLILAAALMWAAEKFQMFDVITSVKQSSVSETEIKSDQGPILERPVQVQQQIQQFNAENTDSAIVEPTEAESSEATSPPLLIDEKDTSVEATTVAVPVESGDLKLVFSEDSWTEVNDSVGKRHVYRLVRKDSEIYVDGTPPFIILLGNADGVEVFYKGELFNHKRYQRNEIAYFRLGKPEE